MISNESIVVVAIDFGTSTSGYALLWRDQFQRNPSEKICTYIWKNAHNGLLSSKTPTTVLLDPHGAFDSFGYKAEEKYATLMENEEHKEWFYVQQFKMMLSDVGQDNFKDLMLQDVTGKDIKAIDVFAHSIGYLRKHFMDNVSSRNPAFDLDSNDVHWVITVPELWSSAAVEFMRKAAAKASIFGPNLSICHEAVAASLHVKHVPVEEIAGTKGTYMGVIPGMKYIVIDAGGGTTDITAIEVQENMTLKEISPCRSIPIGGTNVNTAFEVFLKSMVSNEVMGVFKKEHTDDYLDLMREFEMKKRTIKEKKDLASKVRIRIPTSLYEVYEDITKTSLAESVQASLLAEEVSVFRDMMRISSRRFNEMFEATVDAIISETQKTFEKTGVHWIDVVFMVGGFSECPLLRQRICETFPETRIIIPKAAESSVLKGAVIYGFHPQEFVPISGSVDAADMHEYVVVKDSKDIPAMQYANKWSCSIL